MDCEWSDWKVGGCSVTCGGGTRKNTRSKAVPEKYGGMCIGDASKEEVCNDQKCKGNKDCI